MLLVGLLLFVGAEIAAFVVVAEKIGFFWALGIVVVVSALGPLVVRRVGVGVLAHTRERLARGEVPTLELLDGLVVLMGGVMICIPGFIGDGLGLLLMIGPVRRLVIRTAGRRLARRVQTIPVRSWRLPNDRPRATGDSFPPSGPPVGNSVAATTSGPDNPPGRPTANSGRPAPSCPGRSRICKLEDRPRSLPPHASRMMT